MTTPAQGNAVPEGAAYADDNGKFGKGFPGNDRWWAWLQRTTERYGPERCLWAAAPDVPFDAVGTLRESLPWLERIRSLGIPAAFCAQDGAELDMPWEHFDVLFLAGSTDWKTSWTAAELTAEAHALGKRVHMGRVNSRKRLRRAVVFGVDTGDGGYIVRAPDKNLARWQRFEREVAAERPTDVEIDLLVELELHANLELRKAS